MLMTLYTVFMVLFLFGITIFVHELGHFVVARRLGMVAEVFSIGFGPAIWKKKYNGVVYKIGIFPLGGYVALPQMDPDIGAGHSGTPSEDEQSPRRLEPVAPWKKILVAVAGVIGNMILAIILAYIVYWGADSHAPEQENSILGYVNEESEAYAKGFRVGDTITAVNGQPIDNWESFLITAALYDEVDVEILKPTGETESANFTPEKIMGASLIQGISPYNYCKVLKVQPDSSAAEAGLQTGDRITEFNGQELYSRAHLITLVDQHRNESVPAKILRDGETLDVTVKPKYNEKEDRALIGIVFMMHDVKKPWAQIKSHSMLIFRLLKALTTPKEAANAAKAVGGPVSIFAMFWLYVQSSFIMALWFTGLLNVNLAILNMLPIPILDGGHVMFCLWEMITRRPVSHRFVAVVSNAFAILLIGVFILLTYQDIGRFVPLFAKGNPVGGVEQVADPPSTNTAPVE